MEFTLDFARMFAIGLSYTASLLVSLMMITVVLGHIVVRLEKWSGLDAMYYAFITATTVGYGDYHPRKKPSRFLAIVIALVGIVFTGIVFAVALHAGQHAFEETHDATEVARQLAE